MEIPEIDRGHIPEDHVAPDALHGVSRQQTNPSRWKGEGWEPFVKDLQKSDIDIREGRIDKAIFITDAGGQAYGMPHGVARPSSAEDIALILKAAQKYKVPVTTRGGGLTTEGEAVAYGGLLLDMSPMKRVLKIDKRAMTVRTEAGIFWHHLAEELRREGMDYLSAPLNLTSTVGGVLGVGGIDINSPRLGCSADQAVALKVVTPTGEIVECSRSENAELFERVLLGYGQFGVMVEATLKIREFTPMRMQYFYYSSLKKAIADLQLIGKEDASDYSGILTIMDKAINLLVGFDSDEREKVFNKKWKGKLKGHGEAGFMLSLGFYYLLRPWRVKEALYLAGRRLTLFPDLHRKEFMRDGQIFDRTVLFSRAVWKYWGGRQMVIPDLSAETDKFAEAVERGNALCKKYFKYYTLYCVGIKMHGDLPRYEMSCMPPGAKDIAWGCEFEPMLGDYNYSRDYLQAFKNDIYDVGVDMGLSYYRFGGVMKGYIRRVFGDEMVDRHLAMKRAADPAMILNRDVIF